VRDYIPLDNFPETILSPGTWCRPTRPQRANCRYYSLQHIPNSILPTAEKPVAHRPQKAGTPPVALVVDNSQTLFFYLLYVPDNLTIHNMVYFFFDLQIPSIRMYLRMLFALIAL
jgi:hypothetical protein